MNTWELPRKNELLHSGPVYHLKDHLQLETKEIQRRGQLPERLPGNAVNKRMVVMQIDKSF